MPRTKPGTIQAHRLDNMLPAQETSVDCHLMHSPRIGPARHFVACVCGYPVNSYVGFNLNIDDVIASEVRCYPSPENLVGDDDKHEPFDVVIFSGNEAVALIRADADLAPRVIMLGSL